MTALRFLVALLVRVMLYGGALAIVVWMLMTAPLIFLGFAFGLGLLILAVKLGV